MERDWRREEAPSEDREMDSKPSCALVCREWRDEVEEVREEVEEFEGAGLWCARGWVEEGGWTRAR